MPTKRTRRTRGRTVIRMDSFSIRDLLQFMAGWGPPKSDFERSRARWQTWKEYLSDWQAVRVEFMADPTWGQGTPFAERVYRHYGAAGPAAGATHDEVEAEIDDAGAAALLAEVDLGAA